MIIHKHVFTHDAMAGALYVPLIISPHYFPNRILDYKIVENLHTLWIVLDENIANHDALILIYAAWTGHTQDIPATTSYIGTQIDKSLVWHLFGEIK